MDSARRRHLYRAGDAVKTALILTFSQWEKEFTAATASLPMRQTRTGGGHSLSLRERAGVRVLLLNARREAFSDRCYRNEQRRGRLRHVRRRAFCPRHWRWPRWIARGGS